MASFGGHSGGASNKITKITKTRGKMQVVRPILKKLSHSEKNSLDLDRGWEEQSVEQLEHHQLNAWGGSYGLRSSSSKDVSFAFPGPMVFPAGDSSASASASAGVAVAATTVVAATAGSAASAAGVVGVAGVAGVGSGARTKFSHGRSASQASTGSTSRGAFVHPFQQTPRTSTPPLSYANSLASFDNARDYSPTITENEDDDVTHPLAPPHPGHHILPQPPPPTLSQSQSSLRRPSLASQRTASFTDITSPAGPLRVSTGRSTPAPAPRLTHGSSLLTATASHSDLQLSLSLAGLDSPVAPPALASPASSVSAAPMSPLRSSLEAAGFPRLRSRSELDTAARAENIRAARRKFEQRELAKQEKYDREMIRRRERRDNKQATRIEKESAAARKGSMSDTDQPLTRKSYSHQQRPSASRKSTPTSLSTASAPAAIPGSAAAGTGSKSLGMGFWLGGASNSSKDALAGFGGDPKQDDITTEKQMVFASRKYESVPAGQTPPVEFGPTPPLGMSAGDVRFEQARPRRSSTAKRKTQSYWQGFILWLRTKILRMSGSGGRYA